MARKDLAREPLRVTAVSSGLCSATSNGDAARKDPACEPLRVTAVFSGLFFVHLDERLGDFGEHALGLQHLYRRRA